MQVYNSEKYSVQRIAPNILEAFVHDRASLDESDYWKIREMNVIAAGGDTYGVLVNFGYFVSTTEAFDELSNHKHDGNPTVVRAIIASSYGQKVAGNLYLRLKKPTIETKLFSKKSDALRWLKKKMNKPNRFSAA